MLGRKASTIDCKSRKVHRIKGHGRQDDVPRQMGYIWRPRVLRGTSSMQCKHVHGCSIECYRKDRLRVASPGRRKTWKGICREGWPQLPLTGRSGGACQAHDCQKVHHLYKGQHSLAHHLHYLPTPRFTPIASAMDTQAFVMRARP